MRAKRLWVGLLICGMVSTLSIQSAMSQSREREHGSEGREHASETREHATDANTAASMKGIKLASQFYELRYYETASAEKREALVKFMGEAMVPALNRLGVKQVGVFVPTDEKDLKLYVLLVHNSLRSAMTLSDRTLHDKGLWEKGGEQLNVPKKDPLYTRVESTLLGAFTGIPKLEAPEKGAERVYQLRQYESHSIKKGKLKVHMFNNGEIALFRKTGMAPVFFGEALIGPRIPNLTYMVTFKDDEARKANWKKFVSHPEWKEMSSNPKYKETVSNITNIFLKAAPCSQI